MSSPTASARFPPRHHRRAERSCTVGIVHQPLAVILDIQTVHQLSKLAMLEQEARVARMTDVRLIDQERIGDQNASRSERARKFRKQRAVEKVYVHDNIERFVVEMKAIQVCDNGPYRETLSARSGSQSHHRRMRPIDRDYAYSRPRHRERIASASRRHIERDAARYSRNHLDQKRLRRLVAHSTR